MAIEAPSRRVTLVRLDIPFEHLIGFFIKATFAAVPAALLLWFVVALVRFAMSDHSP